MFCLLNEQQPVYIGRKRAASLSTTYIRENWCWYWCGYVHANIRDSARLGASQANHVRQILVRMSLSCINASNRTIEDRRSRRASQSRKRKPRENISVVHESVLNASDRRSRRTSRSRNRTSRSSIEDSRLLRARKENF